MIKLRKLATINPSEMWSGVGLCDPRACLKLIQFAIQIICCEIKLQAIACLCKMQPSQISFLVKLDGFKHSLFTSNFVILYFRVFLHRYSPKKSYSDDLKHKKGVYVFPEQ